MPTIAENHSQWTRYDWEQQGDEWSSTWGTSPYLWAGTLYPRIMRYLPCDHVLEIAPGFGRITRFLKYQCKSMELVDLTERCIEACKKRFQDEAGFRYHVNDGRDLSMIADNSVDFAISFDSLVHADHDVLEAYVTQLATKLRQKGFAFLHHSNLGAFRDEATGTIPFENKHWRSETMSAAKMRDFCEQAGAVCITQELVNWGGTEIHDCFSVFVRKDSPFARECEIYENPDFMKEADALGRIARYYRT